MIRPRVFVTSLGIISPIGADVSQTVEALKNSASGLVPLTLFPSTVDSNPPAGEVSFPISGDISRTHSFALAAAREAMSKADGTPDAIVLGVTTGGMPASESLLKNNCTDPAKYSYHGIGTVAHYVADALGCHGPVLTVSTACSSSMVAIKLACGLLTSGKARRVLVGGADGLCRLTYYGFNSLQLVDPSGARPFDSERHGMSVGEGAAMLLLEASHVPPVGAMAEVLGVGLTCDAFHPAAAHPEGAGAFQAMKKAFADAGCTAKDIDYVNLHGTGTPDNDLVEAKAVRAIFDTNELPLLSSIKGASGHTLGAAGAINAAISVLCIENGLVPANTGCCNPDPALCLTPVSTPQRKPISFVLSNAFGFGGNNASIVLGAPAQTSSFRPCRDKSSAFSVLGSSCLSGAGNLAQTLAALRSASGLSGTVPTQALMEGLDEGTVRRLKRLPRLVLALAIAAGKTAETSAQPDAVFFGTGWGGLSETSDFLAQLFSSGERFASPTDFMNSVHNAPAGHAAIHLQAKGANITLTDGDYSFEQSLFSAGLIEHAAGEAFMVIGADEYHEKLTPLFDASAAAAAIPSDGGGGLLLQLSSESTGLRIAPLFISNDPVPELTLQHLLTVLGGPGAIDKKYGAVFAGIPSAYRFQGRQQLDLFVKAARCLCPIIDYRHVTGEFASASALAAVIALESVKQGKLFDGLCREGAVDLHSQGVLLLGFGPCITAVEILG